MQSGLEGGSKNFSWLFIVNRQSSVRLEIFMMTLNFDVQQSTINTHFQRKEINHWVSEADFVHHVRLICFHADYFLTY